jgi:hypothetical protein
MKVRLKKMRASTQVLVILSLFSIPLFAGCDFNDTPKTSTTCSSGTAQIFVYDGAFKRVCGCTESAGTFGAGSPLNCTVAAGTRIYFHFINLQSSHRIAVTGVGSTRQMDPSSTIDQVDATIVIPATGTYPFSDIFASSMTGNFIVP